ncbi:MAG: sigma-70 family RNA polymerase sigma factor [Isosphaeraceae bacterium]
MSEPRDQAETDESRDLLSRAGDGDGEAMDRLFSRHRDALRRVVSRRLDAGLRARIDPSDVVQEAQIEAFRRLPEYLGRRPMPFRHWLLRTTVERLLKLRRHASAARRDIGRERSLHDGSSTPRTGEALADALPTPSQQVAARDLEVRLHGWLERLGEVDREILSLRAFDGLTHEEAAQRLGIEPAAARKRYGRALLKLRAMMVAEGVTESIP